MHAKNGDFFLGRCDVINTYISVYTIRAHSGHLGHGCVFWGDSYKNPMQIDAIFWSFQIIVFFDTQGSRLGEIVTPDKGLE